MPMPRKPDPEKFCEACGKRLERKRLSSGVLESMHDFKRRKYCGFGCMAIAFDRRGNPNPTNWSQAHEKARSMVPAGPCSKCGAENASDVHHKSGDWTNNLPDNLERLCRTCHNLAHDRRGRCVVCGKPQKGLGYCEKHYQRFKKYGDPLTFKRNQHTALVRLAE